MMLPILIIAGLILIIIVLIPVFLSVSKVYPYAYTNSRLRVMRSDLIRTNDFENLIKRDYNDIIYQLEKKKLPSLTKYLSGDFSYGSVDSALRTELINTLTKVKKISPEESKKFVKLVLSKYDIQLIESIVRTLDAKTDTKTDLVHATEVFSQDFLNKKDHTIEELYNELKGTVYQPLLDKHIKNIKQRKFEEFEKELDLLFFKRMLHGASSIEAKKYVKIMIDNHNIGLALKNLKPIIPGGRIQKEKITNNLEDLKKLVSSKGINSNANTKEKFEKDLHLYLKQTGEKMFNKNPLSEATIVGFIIIKTINIRNLNILLKLKHEKISEEEIKEVLAI
jgi:V/A-type H+/Na+-transporting ATPase subunit C